MQKYNQFPRQGNNFQTFVPDTVRTFKVFLRVTTDNVVAGRVFVHHAKNGRYPPTQNGDIRSLF